MNTISGLVSIARAAELINDGRYLSIAGDEAALKELPKGNWIGGTIPYFMTEAGGAVSRTEVFIDEMPVFDEAPTLLATLNRSPENHPVGFLRKRNFVVQPISKRQRSKLSNTELSPLPEAASPPPGRFFEP